MIFIDLNFIDLICIDLFFDDRIFIDLIAIDRMRLVPSPPFGGEGQGEGQGEGEIDEDSGRGSKQIQLIRHTNCMVFDSGRLPQSGPPTYIYWPNLRMAWHSTWNSYMG